VHRLSHMAEFDGVVLFLLFYSPSCIDAATDAAAAALAAAPTLRDERDRRPPVCSTLHVPPLPACAVRALDLYV